MEHASDPWWIAMAICLVISMFVIAYELRHDVRGVLIFALAFPRALFTKVFGDSPQH
jgi:hypothetical protein